MEKFSVLWTKQDDGSCEFEAEVPVFIFGANTFAPVADTKKLRIKITPEGIDKIRRITQFLQEESEHEEVVARLALKEQGEVTPLKLEDGKLVVNEALHGAVQSFHIYPDFPDGLVIVNLHLNDWKITTSPFVV
jgi:hypothetical protein